MELLWMNARKTEVEKYNSLILLPPFPPTHSLCTAKKKRNADNEWAILLKSYFVGFQWALNCSDEEHIIWNVKNQTFHCSWCIVCTLYLILCCCRCCEIGSAIMWIPINSGGFARKFSCNLWNSSVKSREVLNCIKYQWLFTWWLSHAHAICFQFAMTLEILLFFSNSRTVVFHCCLVFQLLFLHSVEAVSLLLYVE